MSGKIQQHVKKFVQFAHKSILINTNAAHHFRFPKNCNTLNVISSVVLISDSVHLKLILNTH